jgi:hypothetical protein
MAEAPQKPPPASEFVYVDRPELAETFADSLQSVLFDGQSVRLEFCVTRPSEPNPQGGGNRRRYPACRLVLTPAAAVDMINHVQRLTSHLVQAGLLKSEQDGTAAATPQPAKKS